MIAVIDVSGTNLTSLTNALVRLGCPFMLTHEACDIERASHVILPGVGTARFGMNALAEYGLVDLLRSLTQPVLGICLGMQLLFESSDEGDTQCLGLIPGRVELLEKEANHPVPHMGWNQLQWCKESPLRKGLQQEDYVYFVHSFAVQNTKHALAECTYNKKFTAIVQKDNFFGMQFHPEKSAETGMVLLKNFYNLKKRSPY